MKNPSRSTSTSIRFAPYVLLLILLLAFALRMARVGELRMWGDEAYSVFSAQRSLLAITLEGAENDPHPPLYYYLLHFFMPLAGTSELALRFFSVLPGVATAALLYPLGRRLFGTRVGLLASALAAIAPFAVYYAQEIRMYSLAMFLTTLGLYLFVRLMDIHLPVFLRGTVRVPKQSPIPLKSVVGIAPNQKWGDSPPELQGGPATQKPGLGLEALAGDIELVSSKPAKASSPSPCPDTSRPAKWATRNDNSVVSLRAVFASPPGGGGRSLSEQSLTASVLINIGDCFVGIKRLLAMTAGGTWLAYAATMVLALYSLYHAAFILLAQGLVLLPLWKAHRRFVLRWVAVAAMIIAAFLPWLALRFSSTLGHLEDRAGGNAQSLPVFIARGVAALTVGTTLPPTEAMALAVLYVALIAIGSIVALRTRQAQAGDTLVLTLVVVPLLAVYPLYFLLPILVGRLFALAFVPLALLLARGLGLLVGQARLSAIPLALLLLGVSAYSLDDYYYHFDRYNAAAEDYIPLVRAVEAGARPGDMVLFHADWQMGYFYGHYRGPALEYRSFNDGAALNQAVARPRTIWAVIHELPVHGSEVWLAQNAFPIGGQTFGRMRLAEYRAGLPTRGESFSTPVLFNNGMALRGYRINGEPLESGRGLVTVQLDWHATRQLAEDFTVSVRLTNPGGDVVWAQEDSPPASGTRVTSSWEIDQVVQDRHAFVIPPGTPPGIYAVQVVLYPSAGGSAANIIAPENLRAQSLGLGTLEIIRPKVAELVPSLHKPFEAQWAELALAGWAGGAEEIAAGDSLPLTLYWRARAKPAADYAAVLQLVDATGRPGRPLVRRPANETFPTRQWDAGEVWLDKLSVKIPADTAPGDAVLLVGLVDEQSQESVPLHAATPAMLRGSTMPQAVQLLRVRVSSRPHSYALPSPRDALQADLDDKARLLGYDLPSTVYAPGAALPLTLYWQASSQMNERYTVFVHLLDSNGALVAQQDSEPAAGAAPTTSWLRGEIISDQYRIMLPKGLKAGEYTLVVGMYQAASGRRLPVSPGDSDRVTLARIRIAP